MALNIPKVNEPAPQAEAGQIENQGIPDEQIDQPIEDDAMTFVLDAMDVTEDGIDTPVEGADDDSAGVDGGEPAQQAQPQADGQPQPQQPAQQAQPAQDGQQSQQPAQPVQQGLPGQQPNQQQAQPPQQAGTDPTQAFHNLQQALEAKRKEYIEATAQSLEGTISDEDVQEFHDNPRKALAKLGAGLHHDVVNNMMGLIASHIPQVVMGLVQANHQNMAKRNAFFAEYPHLEAHESAVGQIALTVRQMNPQLDSQQFGRMVAAIASQQLNLQPAQVAQQPQGQPQRRQPTFQPAGGRQPAPTPQQQRPSVNGQTNWGYVDEIIEAQDGGRMSGFE